MCPRGPSDASGGRFKKAKILNQTSDILSENQKQIIEEMINEAEEKLKTENSKSGFKTWCVDRVNGLVDNLLFWGLSGVVTFDYLSNHPEVVDELKIIFKVGFHFIANNPLNGIGMIE